MGRNERKVGIYEQMETTTKGGVHTATLSMSGDYNGRSPITPRSLTNFRTTRDERTGEIKTYCKFNPNMVIGQCNTLSEYEVYRDYSLETAGIMVKPELIRIDFKFDNADDDCAHWVKLWEVLIYCFTVKKKVKAKGRYKGGDYWTGEPKSTKVTTDGFEIEVYNKAIQKESEGVTYRAEIRRLRDAHDARRTLEKWVTLLHQLPTAYNAACEHFVEATAADWHDLQQRTRDKLKLNQFIQANSARIFCNEQLQALYKRLGTENPSRAASNYRLRYRYDFVTQSELQAFADEMCEIIRQYIYG